MSWLWLVLASVQAQTMTVPPEGSSEPVRIACPVNQTTRIVFPEALRQLRGGSPLGLTVERTKPEGVIAVRPTAHPAESLVEFRGPRLAVRLRLETAPGGEGTEIRLVLPEPPRPTPAPEPAPSPPPKPEPPASAAPRPPGLDLQGILRARVVAVGRREGLPGQPPMVLVDALRGEKWVWLRFVLEGGARSRIARVSWEGGDVPTHTHEAAGKDLRIVVQLARDVVARAHLVLEVDSGPSYTFALGSRWLGKLLKED